MDESIGQLLTLAVIFGAWIVKGVIDAKKKKERAAGRVRHRPDGGAVPLPVPPPVPPPIPRPTPTHRRTAQPTAPTPRPHAAVQGWDTHGTVARVERTRERRTRALRILAPRLRDGGARALTRAGVLWSEVLGPPRAYRGPHRPPASDRPL